jgi:DUF4097 and DUF4098 domain-containing protein YvlB
MPTYTFDTPEPVDLRVANPSGNVAVTTMNGATTTEIVIEGSEKHFDQDVEVEQRGNQIRVKIEPENRWGNGHDYDVQITVPAHSDARVDTASADVHLGGEYGDVRVNTASGEVHLEVADSVRIETASGEIHVEHARDDGKFNSASGEIHVERCDGDKLEVSTASGEIHVGYAAGDLRANGASSDIHAEEVHGDFVAAVASGDVNVEYLHAGQAKVETVSGDVDLGVAEGTAIWLDIHTMTGDVDVEQEMGSEPQDGQPTLELRVNTLSGDVNVHREGRRESPAQIRGGADQHAVSDQDAAAYQD